MSDQERQDGVPRLTSVEQSESNGRPLAVHDVPVPCPTAGGAYTASPMSWHDMAASEKVSGMPAAQTPAGDMKYEDDGHSTHLLRMMDSMRSEWQLCDVVLEVADRSIRAHRLVLCATSPYFCAMFTGGLREREEAKVTLRGVDPDAVEQLVSFAYTGRVTVREDNVQTLLPAASLLQVGGVQRACAKFLKEELDCYNCLGIAQFADLHHCLELLAEAEQFAQAHFEHVAESEEFVQLGAEELCRLLSCDDLGVSNEEQVAHAVMRWLRHDRQGRRQHLASILQLVRLTQLPPPALIELGADETVRSLVDCRDLIDEAKNYLLLPDSRSRFASELTRPRRCAQNDVLYAVGGWCTGEALSVVERYDWQADEWTVVASMSKRRCGVGVAVVGEFLFALGGHDGNSYLNSVERYDPRTNLWSACVQATGVCRTSVGMGVLGDSIYAVGGQDGVRCLDLVERYDVSLNRWSVAPNMTSCRLGVAVAVLDGLLYAIGGSDGGSPLSTAERFDPVTNKWEVISPMITKRKHLGAAALDGCLYAAGGRDEHSELNSVERYDPKLNRWQPVVAMTCRRSGVGLAVLNSQLMAFGGFDGLMYLRSVERLHVESGQWRLVAMMNHRRLGGGVAVVEACKAAPVPRPAFKPMPGLT